MAPGATMHPEASSSSAPRPLMCPEILAIAPSLTARSARYDGRPLPSTIVPPRMMRSYSGLATEGTDHSFRARHYVLKSWTIETNLGLRMGDIGVVSCGKDSDLMQVANDIAACPHKMGTREAFSSPRIAPP